MSGAGGSAYPETVDLSPEDWDLFVETFEEASGEAAAFERLAKRLAEDAVIRVYEAGHRIPCANEHPEMATCWLCDDARP